MSKKAKIVLFSILGAVFAAIAVLVIVYVVPVATLLHQMDFCSKDTGVNLVDTTLTTEQKLKDFDYMYEIVCLNNPDKECFEKAYGISYDDIYNRYRELVINSESGFEFYSYMANFVSVLPGRHNVLCSPDYAQIVSSGYSLTELNGNQEMKDFTYSWHEDFRSATAEYLDYSLIDFKYIDGKYYGISLSDKVKHIDDYAGGELISIDGRDPNDMCFELFESTTPFYDSVNDCFFRANLLFNDGTGVKHTAEILMPDGTTVTAEFYDDPCYDMALLNALSYYPELFGDGQAASSAGNSSTASEDSASNAPRSYTITKDPDRKLVYVNVRKCNTAEVNRLVADLNTAVEEAGADTLILDIRENSGGRIDFATGGLLPAIFSHDVPYVAHVRGMRNDYTRNYYGSIVYKLFDGGIDFTLDHDYFYYDQDFSIKGNAAHDLKIYLLTSQTTFSTADIITRLCKEYDNCTVIGTNTGGEGVCGTILQCTLPESHFAFCYPCSTNTEYLDDSLYGTEPDIYIHYTADEYYARKNYASQGLDADSYEVRQMWDQTLMKAIELAEED